MVGERGHSSVARDTVCSSWLCSVCLGDKQAEANGVGEGNAVPVLGRTVLWGVVLVKGKR